MNAVSSLAYYMPVPGSYQGERIPLYLDVFAGLRAAKSGNLHDEGKSRSASCETLLFLYYDAKANPRELYRHARPEPEG